MSAALAAVWPFYAGSFTWNVALGMTHLLVPLYAYHLGYSGVAIGTLVSAPVIVQPLLNLVGGAYTDRVGGHRLAIGSAAGMGIAGIAYAYGTSFVALLAAQWCVVMSRGIFWPATWSMGSQLPGERNRRMGLLNTVTSAGQIIGTALAGLAAAQFGFRATFLALAVIGGLVSTALLAAFSPARPHGARVTTPIVTVYKRLLARPSIYFALLCAYLSALPFSLAFSFYPILIVAQGFTTDEAGWMIALRGVGAVCAGVAAAGAVRRVASPTVALVSGIGIALCVILVAVVAHPLLISLFIFGVGLGSGVMTLYFQLLISEFSSAETRGSALALGALGWSISHLTTPLAMGALRDAYGIQTAFFAMGLFALVASATVVPVHRWAFRDGRPR